MHLSTGVVVDRYRIEETLGEGGMGTVYRVTHTVLGSTHALKVMHPERLGDEGLRERFLAEGRILAQLQHPNVVRVTDVVALNDLAGLVQDLVDGPPLYDHLTGLGRPLTPAEALDILGPVLDGVHHVHGNGIVHRDLKPTNILLASDPSGGLRPVVVDFGVAKLVAGAAVDHQRKQATLAGSVMGTLYYMSPEQVVGSTSVDHRTDIFALGAILFEMLTGQVAFAGQTDYLIQKRIVDCDFDRTLLGQRAPRAVAEVTDRAMAKDPGDRFQTCEEFAQALRAAVQAPATGPVPQPPPVPGPGPQVQATPPPQPMPAQPTPAQPQPAQPTPAQPQPAQPTPAQPQPAQPLPAQPPPAPQSVPTSTERPAGKSGLLVGIGVGLAVVVGGGLLVALLVVGGVLVSNDDPPARSRDRAVAEPEAQPAEAERPPTVTDSSSRTSGGASSATVAAVSGREAVAYCDATRKHSTCIDYDATATAGVDDDALRALCGLLDGTWGSGSCPQASRSGACDDGAGCLTHTYSTGGDPRDSRRARALCNATGGDFDSSP